MSQMNVVLNKPIDGFNMNSEEGKMFVGGIKQDTTDEDFKDFFGKYGELTDCVLMKDQATNRPRGFGFIRYKDPSDVSKVLADAPHFLNGKRIDPKQCLPRNLSREMSRASGGRGMMGSGDAPLSQKIFIGGVGQTSEEDIQKAFSSYGNVLEVVLMMDKVTGNCRGFGFVTFDSEESVNELCSRQFVEILDKKVEIKKAQPRDSSGAPSGGGWSNSGPPGMNQHGMGGPGGPPMGAWNQPQNQGGWNQNQGPGGGQGGFNQQNNFGGQWGQPQQPMGNFQQGQGNYGGQQQQQQQQQQQPGQQGGWNQNASQGGNGYGQQPQQNYGGNYGRPQQQQQPQPNSYGGGQQSYGNYGGAYGQQQQQQQQQQPNMYGNQGGGDAQQAYGGQQQNYSNPQQQQQQQQGQQANVGNNYAQEASGYGPTRVNSYNNAAGYNQPAGQGGAAYGQTAMAGNYNNGQQQQQQQQPMQQQQPPQQQRQPMQHQQQPPQQAMQQQQPQQQQGSYGQQPPGVGGPPGVNYQQQQQKPGAPQQAQTFHPYRR